MNFQFSLFFFLFTSLILRNRAWNACRFGKHVMSELNPKVGQELCIGYCNLWLFKHLTSCKIPGSHRKSLNNTPHYQPTSTLFWSAASPMALRPQQHEKSTETYSMMASLVMFNEEAGYVHACACTLTRCWFLGNRCCRFTASPKEAEVDAALARITG